MRKGKILNKLPLIIMGLFFLAALYYVLVYGNIKAETLLLYRPKNKWLAAAFLLLAFAVKSQTVLIFYGAIVTATVIMFPLPEAIIINTLGGGIMITLPYLAGRFTDIDKAAKKIEKNAGLSSALNLMRDKVFLGTFLLRVSALPGDLISLFYGTLKVKFLPFFFGSLLGLMPAMIAYTLIGLGLSSKSPFMIAVIAVYAAVIAAALMILRRLQKKAGEQ